MTEIEQLWHDHAAGLLRYLDRRVRMPQDAEDLLQEVFLRAVRTPPATAGPAWLFTVARTVLIDHYRRAAGRHETPLAAVPDHPQDQIAQTALAAERLARCAAGMLHQLPAPQADALRLVDMAATKQHQAAEAAGVSVSGMKSRVQRGRAALRALIESCCSVTRDARGAVLEMGPCARSCC